LSRSSSLHITPPLPTHTLFPYTPLFRSKNQITDLDPVVHRLAHAGRADDGDRHAVLQGQERHDLVRGRRPAEEVYKQATHKVMRSEEHTSELQSRENIVCRLLLEKKKMT